MQSNLDYLVSSMLVHSPGTNIRLISTINRSILPAGLGARGVSSEHVENMENAEKMEMFCGSPLRCSLVLQLRCAPGLGEPCSN